MILIVIPPPPGMIHISFYLNKVDTFVSALFSFVVAVAAYPVVTSYILILFIVLKVIFYKMGRGGGGFTDDDTGKWPLNVGHSFGHYKILPKWI